MPQKQEKSTTLQQQVDRLLFKSTPNDHIINIPTGHGLFQVSSLEYQDGYGKSVGRQPIKVKKNKYSEPE